MEYLPSLEMKTDKAGEKLTYTKQMLSKGSSNTKILSLECNKETDKLSIVMIKGNNEKRETCKIGIIQKIYREKDQVVLGIRIETLNKDTGNGQFNCFTIKI